MSCALGNPFGTWMNHMWGTPFWGMGWWMIFGVLTLVAIGYGVYYAMFRPRSYRRRREDPFEMARIRLARGEITAEEFEEIKRKLAV